MSGLKLAGAAGALVLVVATAAAASPGNNRTRELRAQASTLGNRAHSAELDLYALDAHLASTRAQLTSLQAQAAQLRQRQLQLSAQLSATRQTLVVSQRQLDASLRLLYEQGESDPLAVMLGAKSLDEAVTRLDDLQRVTEQSKRFVQVSTSARTRLVRLRATLATARARIGDAARTAQATAARLEATRADRVAFIARLRREQRLKTAQIRSVEATVRKAETKSAAITAAVPAPVLPTAAETPAAAPAPVPGARTLTVAATGYSLPGHTATGLPVGWGVVAVDPSLIPLGTRLTIPGYGDAVAADVGSGVQGAMIDLWFPTLAQARAWGRRTVTITLH